MVAPAKKDDITQVRWVINSFNEDYVSRRDILAYLRNDQNSELKDILGAKYISLWLQCVLEEIGEPADHKEKDTGEYLWGGVSLRYVFSDDDGLYIKHDDFYKLLEMKGEKEEEADFTKAGIHYIKSKLDYMVKGEKRQRKSD